MSAVPSEKCVVHWGSEYDEMRMADAIAHREQPGEVRIEIPGSIAKVL